MTSAAQEAFDNLMPEGQTDALVTMETLWSQVAMDVILRTLFSRSAQQESLAAVDATQVLSATAYNEMFRLFTLPDWLPLPGKAAKRKALRTLRQLIQGHITERQTAIAAQPEQATRTDLLGRLLALRDDATGTALSDQEVFDQCMVSFQAGHETSATALLWWSRLMAEHPAVAQRAREEVLAVVGAATPGPEHMAQLPWLTATLKEAMRLYPPVAAVMSRRTTATIILDGWHIPKGAMLRITPWVLHHDERWFANAQDFRPERFLDGAPPIPKGAWMPFGAGPRVCLGQHFAMMEMTLLSAMLLQRFALELPEHAAPCVPELHVTLRPQKSVQLRLTRIPEGQLTV
jgi:cytochrome P450